MRAKVVVTVSVLAVVFATGCAEKAGEKTVAVQKNPPKILQFYASEGVVRPGAPVTICYGVEYAETVRIEPFIEEIKPAISRCIEAKPEKTTLYTMTAEGPDRKAEASFTISTDAN